MPRTTLNLDASVLRELKERQHREGRSLGELVSELLAHALAVEPSGSPGEHFPWRSQPMGVRIDLEDRDALEAALARDAS